jgi:anti-sigma factor RsiW
MKEILMSLDNEVLSAYMDGEVPGKFEHEIAEQIRCDPEVSRRYSMLMELRVVLHNDPEPDFSAGQKKIWRRLAVRGIRAGGTGFFARRVDLPLPVVAAAAVVFLVLAGITMVTVAGTGAYETPPAIGALRTDPAVPKISTEEIYRVLGIPERSEEIMIFLPDAPRFQMHSAPALVHPADYRSFAE